MEKDLKKGVDYIGVNCIFFCHDGQGNFLLHKRGQNCRDERGKWDCGGGSMEFGESFSDTVSREVEEEYGVLPVKIEYLGSRSVIREHEGQKTHWIANLHLVQLDPAGVKIGEPHKIDAIGWFCLDKFPAPLHSQLEKDLAMLKNYFKNNNDYAQGN